MSHLAKILIVDDRAENLLALEATLEPLGQELVRARSGVEALKRLLLDDYALILLDVQMPGMDGFETAARIKEREKSRYIPIIFLTALSTQEQDVFQGYTAGAVDYIAKPFHPEILRSKVRIFMELYEKTEQVKMQADLLRQRDLRDGERLLRELQRDLEQKHLMDMAQLQFGFLRDVLLSVTEGRLTLCQSEEEFPEPLSVPIGHVSLSPHGAIRDLRDCARKAATQAGLPDLRWQDLVTAASEAAMNAVVHGRNGEGQVYLDPRGSVQVWIRDHGRGIAIENISRATLERGYTTAGTMGHGFWLILETVDRVFLNTGPTGTTIVIEQARTRPQPPWLRE
ncbi:hypothetical protein CCAX7_34710 [Capsulimonas corticalis]|uniref:Uncharacterized protein n=1 Tax=Capsulimonas corticalis TaxID=2219043 RepID=A0A402CYA0_9BACT|nr:response regulator [Capsulimonas corticalis]BDI31420.1 hypothetical protein CCAX7_34710 [Capsulimonas corticalis]